MPEWNSGSCGHPLRCSWTPNTPALSLLMPSPPVFAPPAGSATAGRAESRGRSDPRCHVAWDGTARRNPIRDQLATDRRVLPADHPREPPAPNQASMSSAKVILAVGIVPAPQGVMSSPNPSRNSRGASDAFWPSSATRATKYGTAPADDEAGPGRANAARPSPLHERSPGTAAATGLASTSVEVEADASRGRLGPFRVCRWRPHRSSAFRSCSTTKQPVTCSGDLEQTRRRTALRRLLSADESALRRMATAGRQVASESLDSAWCRQRAGRPFGGDFRLTRAVRSTS